MTRGLLIAAPASGAGKTTVTLGLLRALRDRGARVAAAKSGPDYIDPAFHAAAAGRDCVNLDAWAMPPARLRALAAEAARGADLLLVEGAMGLFDGAPDGTGAAADLAAALGLPVLLVLDVARQGQSVAALAAGFARHRADVTVAGLLLNRTGSPRHAALLRAALAPLGLPVLGALPADPGLALPARHLGLVQAAEHPDLAGFLARAGAWVAGAADPAGLLDLARPLAPAGPAPALEPIGQRIALARDEAFAFAYPHLLADWRRAGAEILPFAPLADEGPDAAADAVFLPGGYPELHAGRLAAAERFRAGMAAAAARGALILGECGGYMVLGRGLEDAAGARHAMLGLLDLETSFAAPRRVLGYRRLAALPGAPVAGRFRGHEFHYARELRARGAPLFAVRDAAGAALPDAGLRAGRVAGSFAHVIDREG